MQFPWVCMTKENGATGEGPRQKGERSNGSGFHILLEASVIWQNISSIMAFRLTPWPQVAQP